MIKAIAFDFGGVLVKEKDIPLSNIETKIEQYFGPNNSDEEFINEIISNGVLKDKDQIISTAKDIIFKLYDPVNISIISKLKKDYPEIKLNIATNHISIIKEYIQKVCDMDYLDNIFISADLHVSKPDKNFYTIILNTLKCTPNELIFLDDHIENINAANTLGIHTILVTSEKNIIEKIISIIHDNI